MPFKHILEGRHWEKTSYCDGRSNTLWNVKIKIRAVQFFQIFFCVCDVCVLWNREKRLWVTTLLIVGPGVLLSTSRASFSFGTIDVQLEWGVWRVGWEWPVDYPRERIGFDTMTNTCVKNAMNVSLFPTVVCPFVCSIGRTSIRTQQGARGALTSTIECRLWSPFFCRITLLIWQLDSLCQL